MLLCYYVILIAGLIFSSCSKNSDIAGNKITFEPDKQGSLIFNCILPGERIPSFRILAPEHITTNDRDLGEEAGFKWFHIMQAKSYQRDGTLVIEHLFENLFEFRLTVTPREMYVDIELSIKNIDNKPWNGLQANFCSGLTKPSDVKSNDMWINRIFFPDTVMYRKEIGEYWFSKIVPKRFKYYDGKEWKLAHPNPENPNSSEFPEWLSEEAKNKTDKIGRIIALEAHDNQPQLFQMWNVEGVVWDPFPGNACMHIIPIVAERLNPKEVASIKGRIGFWGKSLDDLLSFYNLSNSPQ